MAENSANAGELHRLIDKLLLTNPPDSVHNFFNHVIAQCKNSNMAFDGNVVLEYWWHLARIGAVVIPGGQIGALPANKFSHLLVTERGKRLLQRGESSPHDPPRYLNSIRQRITNPDRIVIDYVDEAVGAWACGLNRASVVMLGCACERLILILAEATVAAGIKPWSDNIKKELDRTVVGISRLFNSVLEFLKELDAKKQLPAKLSDALDRKISAIFDHARGLRNKSGHPTGTDVSSEDAEAGLLLFPGFYVLVDDLIKYLSTIASTKSTAKL